MRDLKRSLKLDVDIQTLRSMREQGMSNKQIADNLGISVSTVYRHLGRKSQDVKYNEIQNKPCPVPNPTGFVKEVYVSEASKEEIENKNVDTPHGGTFDDIHVNEKPNGENMLDPDAKPVIPDSSPLLRMISSRFKLQGSLCNYEVDTDSGTIEMQEGIITGLLDKDTVRRFLSELNEVADMLDKMKL